MDKPHIEILALDDDDLDLTILERFCRRVRPWRVTLIAMSPTEDLRNALASHDLRLLFIDYRLGAAMGTEVVQRLRSEGCTLPIYLLTGYEEQDLGPELLQSGADGCISKQRLSPEMLENFLTELL